MILKKRVRDTRIVVIHATITRDNMTIDLTTPLDKFITKSMPKMRAGDSVSFTVDEMMQSEYDGLPDKPEKSLDAKKLSASMG
jgi:hypothetical protein